MILEAKLNQFFNTHSTTLRDVVEQINNGSHSAHELTTLFYLAQIQYDRLACATHYSDYSFINSFVQEAFSDTPEIELTKHFNKATTIAKLYCLLMMIAKIKQSSLSDLHKAQLVILVLVALALVAQSENHSNQNDGILSQILLTDALVSLKVAPTPPPASPLRT